MNKRIFIVAFFAFLFLAGSVYAAIGITELRTEQLKNPLGIDVRQPRQRITFLLLLLPTCWRKEREIFGIQER